MITSIPMGTVNDDFRLSCPMVSWFTVCYWFGNKYEKIFVNLDVTRTFIGMSIFNEYNLNEILTCISIRCLLNWIYSIGCTWTYRSHAQSGTIVIRNVAVAIRSIGKIARLLRLVFNEFLIRWNISKHVQVFVLQSPSNSSILNLEQFCAK
jgi:hypothetical protein